MYLIVRVSGMRQSYLKKVVSPCSSSQLTHCLYKGSAFLQGQRATCARDKYTMSPTGNCQPVDLCFARQLTGASKLDDAYIGRFVCVVDGNPRHTFDPVHDGIGNMRH